VVLASNRGLYSSNLIKLVEWCVFILPLELFFKDNSLLAAHLGYPHPCPHGGDRVLCPSVLCSLLFLSVLPFGYTPEYGRFSTARAATHITAALAENLPHRSREHEFSAGRVGIFFENQFLPAVKRTFI